MLLDTNILVDAALDRQPHSAPALELLDRIESGADRAFVAWHSVATCHYLVSRSRGDAAAREFVLDLMRYVEVAPASADAIRFAASLPMDDFEDAMQVASARFCGARRIITRNLKDFANSPIPAVSPGQALAELV